MNVIKDEVYKCTRSFPRCDQCMKPVFKEEKYRYQLSKDGGDLMIYTAHIECDEAASKFNNLVGLSGDESYGLQDLETYNYEWLLEDYPVVAGRLNIQGPVDIRRLDFEALMDRKILNG